MRHPIAALFCLAICLNATTSRAEQPSPGSGFLPIDPGQKISRIAFGSCSDPRKPVPVFETITRDEPDLMIFLGDNVYADTTDRVRLRAAYEDLADDKAFQRLRDVSPILATWDDHDYGINDGGAEHPTKAMSQQVFLDFWGVPASSPRRDREGVYHSLTLGPDGRRVQVILLDTRYHRGPLKQADEPRELGIGPYLPDYDPGMHVTFLGEAQWAWLEQRLREPAEVRLIASSIQVIAEDHNWEAWAMIPVERKRLLELITETGANGVVFLSGDRHHAELSRLTDGVPYPLYDVTASGMNKTGMERDEPNRHRVGQRVREANFGLIDIDWDAEPPAMNIRVLNADGVMRIGQRVTLDELAADR
jgi:alkaline phosphatase D